MHIVFDKDGYVCCLLYGCHSDGCVEYLGKVPTEPEEYADIDDWAERAQTSAYYRDEAGNLAYDASKAVVDDELVVDTSGSYSLDETLTPARWIDGKPIYKQTFVCEITTMGAYVDAGTIKNLGSVVDISGVALAANGNWVSVNSYYSDEYSKYVRITGAGVVQGYGMGSAVTMYITVCYTKQN